MAALAVEAFNLWSPFTKSILKDIASRGAVFSGTDRPTATNNLLQQLALKLWLGNLVVTICEGCLGTVQVGGRDIMEHTGYQALDSVSAVMAVISIVDRGNICCGNPDEKFYPLVTARFMVCEIACLQHGTVIITYCCKHYCCRQ